MLAARDPEACVGTQVGWGWLVGGSRVVGGAREESVPRVERALGEPLDHALVRDGPGRLGSGARYRRGVPPKHCWRRWQIAQTSVSRRSICCCPRRAAV